MMSLLIELDMGASKKFITRGEYLNLIGDYSIFRSIKRNKTREVQEFLFSKYAIKIKVIFLQTDVKKVAVMFADTNEDFKALLKELEKYCW
jgi:hypothetical protein